MSSSWCHTVYRRLARLAPASSSLARGDQLALARGEGLALGQHCSNAFWISFWRASRGSSWSSQPELLIKLFSFSLFSFWSANRLLVVRLSPGLTPSSILIGIWSFVRAHSSMGPQNITLLCSLWVTNVRSIVDSCALRRQVGSPVAVMRSSPSLPVASSRCSAS